MKDSLAIAATNSKFSNNFIFYDTYHDRTSRGSDVKRLRSESIRTVPTTDVIYAITLQGLNIIYRTIAAER